MTTDYYVIGDDFDTFAEHPDVLTATQLQQALALDALDLKATRLIAGLGLDALDFDALRDSLRLAGAPAHVIESFGCEHAELAHTHKHRDAHVMIGAIAADGDATYSCALIVNALRDRLSDHVTGQHVGGMLLIEAARQLAIAAAELEYSEGGRKRWGLAWSGLHVGFSSYTFPLPAKLRAQCNEDVARRKPNQRAVRLEVAVEQAGQCVCELAFDCTLIEAAVLSKMEQKAAARALTRARSLSQPSDELLQRAG